MSDTPKHDDMEVRHAAAAGLDVHKMKCWVQHFGTYVGLGPQFHCATRAFG